MIAFWQFPFRGFPRINGGVWAAAFVLALAITSALAQTADTRWRLHVHVLYDAGLKIEKSKETWGDEVACDRAGRAKEVWFERRRIMASSMCVPVHIILNLGKFYT